MPTPLQTSAVKQDAARFIVGMALSGLATGGALRAIPGIKETFAPTPVVPRNRSFRPVPLPNEEEEKRADENMLNTHVLSPAADLVKTQLLDRIGWFGGSQASHPMGVPAALGIGIPAGLAAGYAGYKGVDMLLDHRRKSEQQAELDEAKKQYESLMSPKLAEAFDKLAEESCEKLATDPSLGERIMQGVHNVGGAATGGYATLATLLAGTSGVLAYNATRKTNKKDVLQEAMRERTRTPAAVPLPFHVYPEGGYPPR